MGRSRWAMRTTSTFLSGEMGYQLEDYPFTAQHADRSHHTTLIFLSGQFHRSPVEARLSLEPVSVAVESNRRERPPGADGGRPGPAKPSRPVSAPGDRCESGGVSLQTGPKRGR